MSARQDTERANTISFSPSDSQDGSVMTDGSGSSPDSDFAVPAVPIYYAPVPTANESFTIHTLSMAQVAEALDGVDETSPSPTSDLTAPAAAVPSNPAQLLDRPAETPTPPGKVVSESESASTLRTPETPSPIVSSESPSSLSTHESPSPIVSSESPSSLRTQEPPDPFRTPDNPIRIRQRGPRIPSPLITPGNEHVPYRSVKWEGVTDTDQPARARPSDSQKPVTITREMRRAFHKLLDDRAIEIFLQHDGCKRVSDKYLLAMVLVYFSRAGLSIAEYNIRNFYAALFLANQMEEDIPFYYSIFLFADWYFSSEEDFKEATKTLFRRMRFRAWVSREECRHVMKRLSHRGWRRKRMDHHGLAHRDFRITTEECTAMEPGSGYVCDQCSRSRPRSWCCIMQ
ncbi:speedy protein E4-like [Hyperolius riggenbachi]|uniref:speedy protein E4-like n=1 Tax=Hyperolius riggenbachi TaxID=752182 RepID=UPI0035A2EB92